MFGEPLEHVHMHIYMCIYIAPQSPACLSIRMISQHTSRDPGIPVLIVPTSHFYTASAIVWEPK